MAESEDIALWDAASGRLLRTLKCTGARQQLI